MNPSVMEMAYACLVALGFFLFWEEISDIHDKIIRSNCKIKPKDYIVFLKQNKDGIEVIEINGVIYKMLKSGM